MKKVFLSMVVFCFLFSALYSQNDVIEGKSKPKSFSFEPEYKRGLPPNLFVDLNFKDDNRNGIIEAREKGTLELTITNKGKGPAQGLVVDVEDNTYDRNFKINDGKKIYFIHPGESKK